LTKFLDIFLFRIYVFKENVLAQKERELREQVKRDRDKEIELVISRLESETTLTRDESERAAENRVK
jgi:5-azacytidine-induced protein 1